MKLAITGKGGTGKTTIAGVLARYFSADGYEVLAVDADPVANLASAIGIPEVEARAIVPVSRRRQLIKERTGAKPGELGQMFKINPTVNDIPDKYCVHFHGIKLLVMGGIQKGGSGCACPENALLRGLLSEIILNRNEVVIVDMEAGIEHLGRATSRSIDRMLIVVEPGWRSLEAAKTIMKLAGEIGVKSFGVIGNKIQNDHQKGWIQGQFPPDLVLGMVSYRDLIQEADLNRRSLVDILDEALKQEFNEIYRALKSGLLSGQETKAL
jgi:CO dehydrogenase maturation factor